MASHFECIGVSGEPRTFFDFIDEVAKNGIRKPTFRGDYIQYLDPSGAETWLQLDKGMSVLGINPHYATALSVPCEITNLVDLDYGSPLDATLHAWVNPRYGDDLQGDYPLVFDCPDYWLQVPIQFPIRCGIQFAAFASEVSYYSSSAEFKASQVGRDTSLGDQALIPVGLFGEGPPRPQILMSGVVRNVVQKTNKLTGNAFYAMIADTFGGSMNVVTPRGLGNELPIEGGIICGTFWLSGKLMRKAGPPPLPKI